VKFKVCPCSGGVIDAISRSKAVGEKVREVGNVVCVIEIILESGRGLFALTAQGRSLSRMGL
jgi:hypothetical protein